MADTRPSLTEPEPPDPEKTVKRQAERTQIHQKVPESAGPHAEPTLVSGVKVQKPEITESVDKPKKAPAKPKLPSKLEKRLNKFARRLGIRRQIRLSQWGTVVGLSGLLVGTIAISVVLAVTVRTMIEGDVLNPFEAEEVVFTPVATPNPTFQAPTLEIPQEQPFWGQGPVTVLLLGTDARSWEAGYRTRTDTIIVLMIDPAKERASMLSLPRDLYVELPGRGLERINTAYVYGGAPLAVDTVEYNFGLPIDYYVVINFEVFVTLVDEIGGIDINVPKTINDPTYPDAYDGYDPFYISAGMQHLDGKTALKYARTRHTDNDYERARRQQAVIMAIRDKILRLDMLPTLISKAPALSESLSENIRTDMTLEEMIDLAEAGAEIPTENIRSGVVDSNYIIGYRTPSGAQVSIPKRDEVARLLAHVFWLNE